MYWYNVITSFNSLSEQTGFLYIFRGKVLELITMSFRQALGQSFHLEMLLSILSKGLGAALDSTVGPGQKFWLEVMMDGAKIDPA